MDKEQKWKQAVNKCKIILGSRFQHQIVIATEAINVCEITWGGARVEYDELFTIKRFSNNIGVTAKTLSNWMAIKRNVYDRLKREDQKIASFNDMRKVCCLVSKDTPITTVRKIYNRFTEDTLDSRMLSYLGETRTILSNIENKSAAIVCKKDTLMRFIFTARALLLESKKNVKT